MERCIKKIDRKMLSWIGGISFTLFVSSFILAGVKHSLRQRRHDAQHSQHTSFHHLGSLEYPDGDYRCTGLLISPKQILTTSKCEGAISVLLGSGELKSSSGEFKFKLKINPGQKILENELLLLELIRPISEDEFERNVSVAHRCKDDVDWNNSKTKLFAAGFAQSEDGKICPLYRKKLQFLGADKCEGVRNMNNVNFENNSLVCVKSISIYPPADQYPNCKQCLTGSASVLYVQQPDGNVCVAGIATPTSNKCLRSSKPVLFTLIKSSLEVE